MSEGGYEVVVFLPRTLLGVPVFAPGWYIGFDCAVQAGFDGRTLRQHWASPSSAAAPELGGNEPDQWGDLLLLGTDARFLVQDADPTGTLSQAIIPGHSYLLTVVDPDRNVNLTLEDTVLVSAESSGGDTEVYILRETDRNSGVFRGYIDTQPGAGRQVQGVLECMPGQEVRFAYVDVAKPEEQVQGFRLSEQSMVQSPVFRQAGLYAVTCTRHPWQRAYVFVVDNPYVAVSCHAGHGPSPIFLIENLPLGSWQLEVWNPAHQPVTATLPVEIKNDQTTELMIDFDCPPDLKSPGGQTK